MSLERCDVCLSWPSLLLQALSLVRNDDLVVPRTLYNGVLVCFNFQGVFHNYFFTFLASLF